MGCGVFHSIAQKLGEFRHSGGRLHRPERPITAPWGLRVSAADLAKLLQGFESQQMEQKWDITPSGPDEQGISEIRMTRSWTGQEVFRLKIISRASEDGDQNGPNEHHAEMSEITWDKNVYETEDEAKYNAVDTCREILRCELNEFVGPSF